MICGVLLGQANGLTETVTHPTHVAAVHALSVVTQEHFSDPSAIVGDEVDGLQVMRCECANKMNDLKAHLFGVAADGGGTFVALLEASIHAADRDAAAAEKVSA